MNDLLGKVRHEKDVLLMMRTEEVSDVPRHLCPTLRGAQEHFFHVVGVKYRLPRLSSSHKELKNLVGTTLRMLPHQLQADALVRSLMSCAASLIDLTAIHGVLVWRWRREEGCG